MNIISKNTSETPSNLSENNFMINFDWVNSDENIGTLIGFDYLEKLCGGSSQFMVEVIEIFLSTTDNDMSNLKKAILNKDAHETYKLSHKLRSSFQIVEARECSKLFREIETVVVHQSDWYFIIDNYYKIDHLYFQFISNQLSERIVTLRS